MSDSNTSEKKKYYPVQDHSNFKPFLTWALLMISSLNLFAQSRPNSASKTIVWKMDKLNRIGGYKPFVIGNPVIIKDKAGKSLSFNGVNDGLIIQKIPIQGWPKFTIEVLFKPDGDGPAAPRFIHFEDKELNRGTLEARITPGKLWYLDTFLKNGTTGKGLTLINSNLLHPTDQWYWIALSYDGNKMTSYVNGVKELEGHSNFTALNSGEISIGVRLNKINWFKGLIREIRFHPEALSPSALQIQGNNLTLNPLK